MSIVGPRPLAVIYLDYYNDEEKKRHAGIYTIPLENAVELQPGTTFSVVVQTDTNAVECELEMSIENGGQVIWSCDVSKGNEKTFYQYHNTGYNGCV